MIQNIPKKQGSGRGTPEAIVISYGRTIISQKKGRGKIVKVEDILAGRPHLWPAIIACAMLLIGILPLQYGYFQVLRWITCGIAIFLVYLAYKYKKAWIAAIFGVIAVLFNPIFTIHFGKSIWQLSDIFGGAVFIMSIFFLREPNSE